VKAPLYCHCRRRATAFAVFVRSVYQGPQAYACEAHRTPAHQDLGDLTAPPVCDHCGSPDGVEWEDSRTAYAKCTSAWGRILDFEIDADSLEVYDPNASRPYCRECAEEHHSHWDAMWAEYNSLRY
jgi:hypothetical protein